MRGFARDAAILVAVFVVVTVIAELLGAVDLGTALTFGTIAFMATALVLMILGRRAPADDPAASSAPDAAASAAKAPTPPPRKRRR